MKIWKIKKLYGTLDFKGLFLHEIHSLTLYKMTFLGYLWIKSRINWDEKSIIQSEENNVCLKTVYQKILKLN